MKVLTVQQLLDELESNISPANSTESNKILEQMCDGIGLHQIIYNLDLARNTQLAERTIKKSLQDGLYKADKKQFDRIFSTYYRLLMYPMLINGYQTMCTTREKAKVTSKDINVAFKKGCVDYLGNLPYKLISNIIPLPVLFNHCESGENFMLLAKRLFEAEDNNVFLKDFASEIGYTNVNIESLVEKYLLKMSINVNNGTIFDVLNDEFIVFG